jgi:hypothetical protein
MIQPAKLRVYNYRAHWFVIVISIMAASMKRITITRKITIKKGLGRFQEPALSAFKPLHDEHRKTKEGTESHGEHDFLGLRRKDEHEPFPFHKGRETRHAERH